MFFLGSSVLKHQSFDPTVKLNKCEVTVIVTEAKLLLGDLTETKVLTETFASVASYVAAALPFFMDLFKTTLSLEECLETAYNCQYSLTIRMFGND